MFFRQTSQANQPSRSRLGTISRSLTAIWGLSAGIWLLGGSVAPEASATVRSAVGRGVTFSCQESEAAIRRKAGPAVSSGQSRIYIGYQQVSADNQNPIMVRFDNGRQVWCRTNYEITGDDSRGYGLLWDGGDVLYAVFSSTGTQGSSSQDFRRFATQGWLRNYGTGGGAQVSILARVNPTNGTVSYASFLTAVLSSGRTNSLAVRNLAWTNNRLVVTADSYYSPRRSNTQRMTCSGSSPFVYRVEFAPDLRSVSRASADRCS